MCCMIYTLGHMAHYLCTVHTTGSLAGIRFDKSGGIKILTKNWHMNRSEKRLQNVITNLDGFGLINH